MASPPTTEETLASPPPLEAGVSLGSLTAYAAPIVGATALFYFVQLYFLKYAIDVLLIAPGAVGAIFAVARAGDVVTDPLAGVYGDRTRSRLGRRRPWMLVGAPLLALTAAMLWNLPASLAGNAAIVWITVAALGFYTAFSIYGVAHGALGAELSTDYHERSRIFGARHVFFMLGMLAGAGLMQLSIVQEDARGGAGAVAVGAALVAFLLLMVPPLAVRERAEYRDRGSRSVRSAMRGLWRIPQSRILILVWLIEHMGTGVLGAVSPFFAQYVLDRPDLVAALPVAFFVPSVVSVPLWVRVSRQVGKVVAWRVSMLGMAVCFAATFAVGAGDVTLALVLMLGAGLCAGCGGAMGQARAWRRRGRHGDRVAGLGLRAGR
jgi:Na+/melibiose symporter-like transporter